MNIVLNILSSCCQNRFMCTSVSLTRKCHNATRTIQFKNKFKFSEHEEEPSDFKRQEIKQKPISSKGMILTQPHQEQSGTSNNKAKRHSKTKNVLKTSSNYKKKSDLPEVSVLKDIPSGYEVLHGFHPVCMAFSANKRTFHRVYYKDGLEPSSKLLPLLHKLKSKAIFTQECDTTTLDSLSGSRPHQGICGVVSKLKPSILQETKLKPSILQQTEIDETTNQHSLWLFLDKIHDPMNFGAILRSAYFLGVDKVLISKEGSCSLSPVVSKASSGVLEIQPLFVVDNSLEFLKQKSENGWHVWGATGMYDENNSSQVVDVRNCQRLKPTVLVIGNEGSGVSQELRSVISLWIRVNPGRVLHEGIDSLNVNAATAVMLHTLKTTTNKF